MRSSYSARAPRCTRPTHSDYRFRRRRGAVPAAPKCRVSTGDADRTVPRRGSARDPAGRPDRCRRRGNHRLPRMPFMPTAPSGIFRRAASGGRRYVRRGRVGVAWTRPAGPRRALRRLVRRAASGVGSTRPAGGPGGPVSSPYACGRRRVAPAVPGRPSPADAGGDRHVGARVVRAARAGSHRRSGGCRRSGRPAGTTAWTRRASAPDPDGPDTRKGRPGCPGRPCAVALATQRPSSASKLPASSRSLIAVRKRAASAPSIRRWSYERAR